MITTTRADTLSGRFFFLFVSIFLNAFSNALTVSTNMGSAIWTASAVNLSHWVHLSLGNALFLEGIVVAVANLFLLGRFDYFRLIRNLLYITPFFLFTSRLWTLLHFPGGWHPPPVVAANLRRRWPLWGRRGRFNLPAGQLDHAPQRRPSLHPALPLYARVTSLVPVGLQRSAAVDRLVLLALYRPIIRL